MDRSTGSTGSGADAVPGEAEGAAGAEASPSDGGADAGPGATDATGSGSPGAVARASYWRRHPRWTGGVAVTAVVAGAFTGGWFAAPAGHTYTPQVPASQPITVTAAQARTAEYGWQTLGNRAGDRGPGHEAMEVALSSGKGPHSAAVDVNIDPRTSDAPSFNPDEKPSGEILFTGTIPNMPRVTLVSAGGALLRYVRGPGAGSDGVDKVVRMAPEPWEDSPVTSPPIALNWNRQNDEPFPLAVPRWLTNLRVRGVEDKDGWRPLKVTDGLSDPVPKFTNRTAGGLEDHLVDAHGNCGVGALIQADDTLLGKPEKETFLYSPGWPYAVALDFATTDSVSAYSVHAAPLDDAYVRRLAGALLCGAPGLEEFTASSQVTWTPEWHGTPSSSTGEVAVVRQDVRFPVGGNSSPDDRSGLVEIGMDKPSLYTGLGSNYDSGARFGPEVTVGCVLAGGGLVAVGPDTATTTHLVDPLTGRHWSGPGHVLKIPPGSLPGKGTHLIASAITPGKNGHTDRGDCTAP